MGSCGVDRALNDGQRAARIGQLGRDPCHTSSRTQKVSTCNRAEVLALTRGKVAGA